MKRILFRLTVCIASLVSLTCCNNENNGNDGVEPELVLHNVGELASSGAAAPEGGDFTLKIYASLPWSLEIVSPSVQEWVDVSPAEGEAGENEIVVSTASNRSEEPRSVSVRISCGDISESFDIVQNGIAEDGDYFTISPTTFYIPMSESEIAVSINTNLDYSVEMVNAGWISRISGEGVKEGELVFLAEENTEAVERIGIIRFHAGSDKYDVKVYQEAWTSESWTEKTFYHRSLAMRFTADWCGYCPNMADGFKLAQALAPDKIEVVNYHDEGSGLAFPSTPDLKSLYGVTGLPTGVVDGRVLVRNTDEATIAYNVTEAMRETESKYPASSGISFKSTISGLTLSADITLYIKDAGDYKITAVVLEDGIVGYQKNYYGDDYYNYKHDGVARIALSDIFGDPFSTDSDNVTKVFSYRADIPSGYNKDNLRILVYVHKAYGDYYIDNCVSGKAGTSLDLETVD